MFVVKLYMWPLGRHTSERFLGVATFSCIGQMPTGERAYNVRLFKAPEYGGPGPNDVERLQAPKQRDVWREGTIRGHFPGRGKRGTWDLLGGALRSMLGSRLDGYRSFVLGQEEERRQPTDAPGGAE